METNDGLTEEKQLQDEFSHADEFVSHALEDLEPTVVAGSSVAVVTQSGGVNDVRSVEDQYTSFQIAASEELRAGSKLTQTKEEKLAHFELAAKFSAKAFLAARENVYFRLLAISQYQCAMGLILLVDSEYNSAVTSVIPANLAAVTVEEVFRRNGHYPHERT